MKQYYDRLEQLAKDLNALYANPEYTEDDLETVDKVKLQLSETLRTMRELIPSSELTQP